MINSRTVYRGTKKEIAEQLWRLYFEDKHPVQLTDISAIFEHMDDPVITAVIHTQYRVSELLAWYHQHWNNPQPPDD